MSTIHPNSAWYNQIHRTGGLTNYLGMQPVKWPAFNFSGDLDAPDVLAIGSTTDCGSCLYRGEPND